MSLYYLVDDLEDELRAEINSLKDALTDTIVAVNLLQGIVAKQSAAIKSLIVGDSVAALGHIRGHRDDLNGQEG